MSQARKAADKDVKRISRQKQREFAADSELDGAGVGASPAAGSPTIVRA